MNGLLVSALALLHHQSDTVEECARYCKCSAQNQTKAFPIQFLVKISESHIIGPLAFLTSCPVTSPALFTPLPLRAFAMLFLQLGKHSPLTLDG